jgi:hypothetical protein
MLRAAAWWVPKQRPIRKARLLAAPVFSIYLLL